MLDLLIFLRYRSRRLGALRMQVLEVALPRPPIHEDAMLDKRGD